MPAYIGEYFIFAVLGIILAYATSFTITFFLIPKQTDEASFTNEIDLHAVTEGAYIPLENVPDEVFSTKMMGEGYAIQSENGTIYAPVAGEVTSVFPSKHAIGIKTPNGADVLVHMGIDTVSLDGQGFDVFVKEGDQVTAQTRLAQMDLDFIKKQGKETMVIVLITNMDQVQKFSGVKNLEGMNQAGALLEKVILNA